MPENNSRKWVEIARTGTFADSLGRPQTFTKTDLAAIAAAYDPAQRDAPLCFGHPADNAPAFGWVQKLKTEGEKLFASFAHVPGAVKELVANKHYRHVSISLMPDKVSLRHVALLGAAQPAIDGLAAVELSAQDFGNEQICVEFSADSQTDPQEEKTMATTEELQQQIMALQQQVQALAAECAKLKEEKGDTDTKKDEAEAKAEAVAAEFAAYKGDVVHKAREARASALVEAGKLTPAGKQNALNFAATLGKVTDSVDFAAPNGTTEQISAEESYWRELEARPVDGRFADFSAPPAHAAETGPRSPTFNPTKF